MKRAASPSSNASVDRGQPARKIAKLSADRKIAQVSADRSYSEDSSTIKKVLARRQTAPLLRDRSSNKAEKSAKPMQMANPDHGPSQEDKEEEEEEEDSESGSLPSSPKSDVDLDKAPRIDFTSALTSAKSSIELLRWCYQQSGQDWDVMKKMLLGDTRNLPIVSEIRHLWYPSLRREIDNERSNLNDLVMQLSVSAFRCFVVCINTWSLLLQSNLLACVRGFELFGATEMQKLGKMTVAAAKLRPKLQQSNALDVVRCVFSCLYARA